jgi:Spy/CpxP family protein refolding chaperone
MKPQLLSAAVLCLFLLSASAYAQPPNFAEMRKSPQVQQTMKTSMKTVMRSFWDGRGANLMAMGFLQDPEMRTALGVSDEQYQSIQNPMARIGEIPEFQKITEEMQTLRDPNDPFMQNADEETQKKFAALQERMMAVVMNSQADVIENTLTPEQKQKLKEAQLSNMGEIPVIAPSMFEALNLTDAQKQQMEKIKKDLEPEFAKNLDSFADNSMIMADKMFDEMEKQGGVNFANSEEAREKLLAIQKKLRADPEYKKIEDDMQSQGKAFATQFKTKMFDVLTDEQWARLQKLTDDPPEFAKLVLKKMKEQRGESEKRGAAAWQPGPDSWKPGDAIPEQYRQERNTRGNFPRPQQSQ